MKIRILCVGKIKESFYRDAVAEYEKRLGRYCQLEIIEVADEQTPDDASPAMEEQIRLKEAKRLLAWMDKIREDSVFCTLEIQGTRMDSVQFSGWLERAEIEGRGAVCFIIGGSLGLHRTVTERARLHISFSDMTFPHQLMRVILCEQIYRAFRISKGEPYHK